MFQPLDVRGIIGKAPSLTISEGALHTLVISIPMGVQVVSLVFFCIFLILILILRQEIERQKRESLMGRVFQARRYPPSSQPHRASAKNGKQLRRTAAQSRIDHPSRSESWHWRNAQQKIAQNPPNQSTPTRWGPTGVRLNSQQETPRTPTIEDMRALAKLKRQISYGQPASGATKSKLWKLAGSPEIAYGLVQRIQLMHPERSEQWAYEKAIWDLERDRLRH